MLHEKLEKALKELEKETPRSLLSKAASVFIGFFGVLIAFAVLMIVIVVAL